VPRGGFAATFSVVNGRVFGPIHAGVARGCSEAPPRFYSFAFFFRCYVGFSPDNQQAIPRTWRPFSLLRRNSGKPGRCAARFSAAGGKSALE
jgi:hypothetical protein